MNDRPDKSQPSTGEPTNDKPTLFGTVLPFAKRWPLLVGVIAGLLLRFVFSGYPGSNWSAMTGAFIFGTPIVVGAVTVYVAETTQRRSWPYYLYAPFLANCLFVLGTLIIMIEGLICAIVIVPMFALLGTAGGLCMGIVCRVTNWPKQTLYSVMAIPLLLGALGGQIDTPDHVSAVKRSQFIAAPPATVWQRLNQVDNIQPHEFNASWASKIGVPMPQSGITRDTPQGRVRESRWDKAVAFDELITDWQPERFLRWIYRFTPESFPPHALDDHVMIGGHYFDLQDTAFTLTPSGDGTLLTIEAHYRVSTQFNFYADWVAQRLLGNMLETGLTFYQNRSEKGAKKL